MSSKPIIPTQVVTDTSPVERPDLRHNSVFFATVRSVSWGAALGAIFTVAGATLKLLTGGRAGFKHTIGENLVPTAASWAAMLGAFGWTSAMAINYERSKIKPYVEKLENEREILVNNILKNNTR